MEIEKIRTPLCSYTQVFTGSRLACYTALVVTTGVLSVMFQELLRIPIAKDLNPFMQWNYVEYLKWIVPAEAYL